VADDNFFISHGSETIVTGPPIVMVPGQFQLVRDGEVVASIDGRYDFSKVDPQYHEQLFGLLRCQRGMNLVLLPTRQPEPEPEPAPPKRSWWSKLWRSA